MRSGGTSEMTPNDWTLLLVPLIHIFYLNTKGQFSTTGLFFYSKLNAILMKGRYLLIVNELGNCSNSDVSRMEKRTRWNRFKDDFEEAWDT